MYYLTDMTKRLILALILLTATAPFLFAGKNAYIVVDKPAAMLYVIENTDTLMSAPVSAGLNPGDKQRRGDHRTPEGTFSISQICDARHWTHDFKDGHGERKGAYGPWFYRLKTPKWTSIGIHGTCFPELVGTKASEGCIRLRNEDLLKLHKHIRLGMKVIVTPDRPAKK